MADAEHTVLETCSVERFNASLASLVSGGFIQESNSTSLALSRYLEIAEQNRCSGSNRTVSQKPLIINVGEGSTGTKSLNGIMRNLSYNTCHFCQDLALNPESVDSYDMISDTPVPWYTWEWLQSYPQALFIMTMREPVDWRASRVNNHSTPWQGAPCGRSDLCHGAPAASVGECAADAPQTYVVAYSTWAKCVLPADRLHVTSVFTDDQVQSDSEFFDTLIDFLELHGMQRPGWDTLVADARGAYLNYARDAASRA